jgi:hypothetical protein
MEKISTRSAWKIIRCSQVPHFCFEIPCPFAVVAPTMLPSITPIPSPIPIIHAICKLARQASMKPFSSSLHPMLLRSLPHSHPVSPFLSLSLSLLLVVVAVVFSLTHSLTLPLSHLSLSPLCLLRQRKRNKSTSTAGIHITMHRERELTDVNCGDKAMRTPKTPSMGMTRLSSRPMISASTSPTVTMLEAIMATCRFSRFASSTSSAFRLILPVSIEVGF